MLQISVFNNNIIKSVLLVMRRFNHLIQLSYNFFELIIVLGYRQSFPGMLAYVDLMYFWNVFCFGNDMKILLGGRKLKI